MTEPRRLYPTDDELQAIRAEAFDFVGVGLYRYRFDGTVIFMDRNMLRLFEIDDRYPDPEMVAGRQIGELFIYTGPQGGLREEIRKSGVVRGLEYPFETLNGTKKWARHDSYLVRDPQTGEEAIQVIVQDITARKRAEDAARHAQAAVQQYLDIVRVIIVAIDTEQRVTLINQKGAELLGYPQAAIIGRNWYDTFVPAHLRSQVVAASQQLLRGEVAPVEYFENPVVTRTGEERLIAWHNTVLWDDEGHITGTLSAGEDITERTQIEAALRASEENYRTLFESMMDAYVKVDMAGHLIAFNPAYQALLGYTAEELCGLTYVELTPESWRTVEARIVHEQVLPRGYSDVYEKEYRRKDGTVFPVELRTFLLRDARGEPMAMWAIVREITARKQAEAAAQENAERARAHAREVEAILDATPAILFITHDPEARSMTSSRFTSELLGVPPGVNVSKSAPLEERPTHFRALQHGVEIPPEALPVQRAARGEVVRDEELDLVFTDGRHVTIFGNATPLFDERGEAHGAIGAFIDVTARKHIEAELQASAARFRNTLDSLLEGCALLGYDWTYLYINEANARHARLSREAMLGHNMLHVVPGIEASPFYTAYRRCMDERIPQQIEAPFTFQDGTTAWYDVRANPVPEGIFVLSLDITERKQAEAELQQYQRQLQERNQLLEGLYATAPAGIAVFDATYPYQVLLHNQVYQAFWDEPFRTHGMAGKMISEYAPLAEESGIFAVFREVARTGQGQTLYDFPYEGLARGKTWWNWSLSPIYQDGTLVAFGHMLIEVTSQYLARQALEAEIAERKQAEVALREVSERLRLANKATNDVIWDWDVIQNTQRWNEVGTAVFGWTEIVEHPVSAHWWVERVHPDDRERVHASFFAVVHNPELDVWHDEYRFKKADGTYADVLDRGYVLRDDQGQALRMIGAMQDITERKHLERELRELNDTLEQRVHERTAQLEAANKELEAFTYSVSHDLRAPLRAIDGFSQAILEDYADKLNADGREDLAFIRQGAQQMARLIDDLLRLSRVGRAEMRVERVDLSALVDAIAADLQRQEPDRQVAWQIAPDIIAMGDAPLLRIMLENLLGNAWKFTSKCPAARIEFFAMSQNGETVYALRDNGAGFDMIYVEKLFAPFQRLHSAEEFPGTGIGLAIVQRIINRHGGRIWAEGAVGQGATFYFTLPKER